MDGKHSHNCSDSRCMMILRARSACSGLLTMTVAGVETWRRQWRWWWLSFPSDGSAIPASLLHPSPCLLTSWRPTVQYVVQYLSNFPWSFFLAIQWYSRYESLHSAVLYRRCAIRTSRAGTYEVKMYVFDCSYVPVEIIQQNKSNFSQQIKRRKKISGCGSTRTSWLRFLFLFMFYFVPFLHI